MIDFVQITAVEDQDADAGLPSPKKPGRLLFVKYPNAEFEDFEVLDHDGDSALFWATGGISLEYLLTAIIGLPAESGHYVVHGITVSFTRGDGWYTDDDEEWEWKRIEKLDSAIIELPNIVDDKPVEDK